MVLGCRVFSPIDRFRGRCGIVRWVIPLAPLIDSGLVGSTDFHSSHPQGHGRGAARAEDAHGTPTQSHISQSILVCEEN